LPQKPKRDFLIIIIEFPFRQTGFREVMEVTFQIKLHVSAYSIMKEISIKFYCTCFFIVSFISCSEKINEPELSEIAFHIANHDDSNFPPYSSIILDKYISLQEKDII